MTQRDQATEPNNNQEISIKELFAKAGFTARYILSKWLVVVVLAIAGAVGGLCYSLFKKPNYTAISTFVLEDGTKSGSLGQIAGLASLAGIDLNAGGSGLFQGDNILELYKSRSMIEKALLSPAMFNGKKQLLIDRYVDFYDLKERWQKKDDISNISFSGNPEQFNRKQDSLITDIVDKFNKKVLTVTKLDKKLSIIVVKVTCTDELFAKEFTKKLVETVNGFYVLTKTKKSSHNVAVLQHQADSVRMVLNSSISGVASALDAAPNANPQLLSLRVPSQRKQIDVQASSAVYGEIVKNLEISRISLRQDIPLIQLIDQPILPLESDRMGKLKGIVLGFILGGFLAVMLLLVKKMFN